MKILFRAEMLSSNYPKKENECFKLIDNTWYVIGKDSTVEYFEYEGIKLCSILNKYGAWLGKENTKAIHFEDMIDSNNNLIFASLSEDGKGGDLMRCDEYFGVAKYIDCGFMVEYENCIESIFEQNFEVIGEIK